MLKYRVRTRTNRTPTFAAPSSAPLAAHQHENCNARYGANHETNDNECHHNHSEDSRLNADVWAEVGSSRESAQDSADSGISFSASPSMASGSTASLHSGASSALSSLGALDDVEFGQCENLNSAYRNALKENADLHRTVISISERRAIDFDLDAIAETTHCCPSTTTANRNKFVGTLVKISSNSFNNCQGDDESATTPPPPLPERRNLPPPPPPPPVPLRARQAVNFDVIASPPVPARPTLTLSRRQRTMPEDATIACRTLSEAMNLSFVESADTTVRNIRVPHLHPSTVPSVSVTVATPPYSPSINARKGFAVGENGEEKDSKSGLQQRGARARHAPQIGSGTLSARDGSAALASMLNCPANRLSANLSVHHRSNSLGSLSSLESGESATDWGHLRIFTGAVKADTDYVTLKITGQTTCRAIVERILHKFRLSSRDLNLFQLWMEVRTKMYDGREVKSILELDKTAHPLELQRCHPQEMSRFILGMVSNAILAKIFDGEICPQSNYKSVLISRRTTCAEALRLILQMCRVVAPRARNATFAGGKVEDFRRHNSMGSIVGEVIDEDKERIDQRLSDFGLFVEEKSAGGRGASSELVERAQIPADCVIAGVYLSLMPTQRIVLRHIANNLASR